MFGEDELVRSHKQRADAVLIIILCCFAIIIARLWYLQIYKGEEFKLYSYRNSLRPSPIKAARGQIFSRNSGVLVDNVHRYDAIVTPQYLKNKTETLDKLSRILDLPVSTIEKILKKNATQAKYRPIIIKKNISLRERAIIETENSKMPGVSVSSFISREYLDNEIGGHLFGYISEINSSQLPKYRKRDGFNYKLGDFIGQAGLEEFFDLDLRGRDGSEFMEVDALGRMKRVVRSDLFEEIESEDAEQGNSLRLTIDRDLQLVAYNALKDNVGSVVAVDVNSGEILSMVSKPSFDPAQFSRGLTPEYWKSLIENKKNPLRDRNIQEHYAPGSTFKAISAIAALEEGIINEKTKFECKGSFRFGRRTFHCHKKYGHGKVDVVNSLSQSCDIFYYKVATQIDIDTIAKYAKAFGLGSKTGINLPREISGLIPTKEWKLKRDKIEWQKGETLSCIIGQSFVLTTPLQLAMTYATLGNGGTLYRPRLMREIFTNDGKIIKKGKPEKVGEVKVSAKTLELVKKGLFNVVNSNVGSARRSRGLGIRMAGKTGTSQVIGFSADQIYKKCQNREYKFRHHAFFASYAPAHDPKIAVAVAIEHGCSGSGAAAPVAKEVITAYMKKYHPEEHEELKKEDRLRIRQASFRRKKFEESSL